MTHSHRHNIEQKLDKLPASYTSEQIAIMCENLIKDVKEKIYKEADLHVRHRELAYSYPVFFFRIVRGEFDPHIFHSLLSIKSKLDRGDISDERARQLVVLGAKDQVNSSNGPKRKVIGSFTKSVEFGVNVTDCGEIKLSDK